MLSNLLFLIIVLLIVNLAPEAREGLLPLPPLEAFGLGIALFAALSGLIWRQARSSKKPDSMLMIVNGELILFLLAYHFLFVSHRLYSPSSKQLFALTTLSIVSLVLYFSGLAIYHTGAYGRRKMSNKLRFLLPFTLPFLLFGLFFDTLTALPVPQIREVLLHGADSPIEWLLLFVITCLFLAAIMVLLPPLMQKAWACRPLPEGPLKEKLERLCTRARFTHAGMKIWTVMSHSLTAAIVGIVGRYRYVMFTESLLDRFPDDEIEAILAHEIGHSKRKHLLLYPLIIMGMVVLAGLFFQLTGPTLSDFFALHNLVAPSPFWEALYPLTIFVPYALIIALYFRYVFGFFSRNFERQADLHVFEVGIDPEWMINALDDIARQMGNTHSKPSWHHHSVQKRIDFLRLCQKDPTRVRRHHRRVRVILSLYTVFLATAITLLLAPLGKDIPVIGAVAKLSETAAKNLNHQLNAPLRRQVAKQLSRRAQPFENKRVVQLALEKSLTEYGASSIEGIAEFYAAQHLLNDGYLTDSAALMIVAWEVFDFSKTSPAVSEDFETVTELIVAALNKGNPDDLIKQKLLQAMKDHSYDTDS